MSSHIQRGAELRGDYAKVEAGLTRLEKSIDPDDTNVSSGDLMNHLQLTYPLGSLLSFLPFCASLPGTLPLHKHETGLDSTARHLRR